MSVSGSQRYQTAILSGEKDACQANIFICWGFESCKELKDRYIYPLRPNQNPEAKAQAAPVLSWRLLLCLCALPPFPG